MTFDEASQKLTDLINELKTAETPTKITDAKSSLSAFRADNLTLSDRTLRPLRKIARAALEEFDGVVTDLELKAVQNRTKNYQALVAKLNQINRDTDAAELAPKLESALNLITVTQNAVSTVKEVRKISFDQLTADDLMKIDDLLHLITEIPNRMMS
jgi:uncharacterized membrane protein YkoI